MLDRYEPFELLRRSGGKLSTDNLGFIDSIFTDDKGEVIREFFVAGTRYCGLYDSNNCTKKINLFEGEVLNRK